MAVADDHLARVRRSSSDGSASRGKRRSWSKDVDVSDIAARASSVAVHRDAWASHRVVRGADADGSPHGYGADVPDGRALRHRVEGWRPSAGAGEPAPAPPPIDRSSRPACGPGSTRVRRLDDASPRLARVLPTGASVSLRRLPHGPYSRHDLLTRFGPGWRQHVGTCRPDASTARQRSPAGADEDGRASPPAWWPQRSRS